MFWRGAPPKNFENKVKTPLDLLKEIHVCGGDCVLLTIDYLDSENKYGQRER